MAFRITYLAAAFILAAAPAALAADYTTPPVDDGTDLIIELGAGGRAIPEYPGARDYTADAFAIVHVDYLRIPGLYTFGSSTLETGGFYIAPAFVYNQKRDSGDFSEIRGLEDVNATYEPGVRVGYEWEWAEIWGEARYAFGGAEGFVGDFGANAILRPTEEFEIRVGPTASLASDSYMRDYFSVSATESANSGLDQFDANGGFKSVGVNFAAKYEFAPTWFINVDASYNRLIGDAGDSPVSKAGDRDQFTAGLGLSKRFTVDLY